MKKLNETQTVLIMGGNAEAYPAYDKETVAEYCGFLQWQWNYAVVSGNGWNWGVSPHSAEIAAYRGFCISNGYEF
jgi:hypothetical protein